MKCKICGSESGFLFKKKVLAKYDVSYYRCPNCFFIQTEEPYWFEEAYSNAITSLDIGLVRRNQRYAPVVDALIGHFFDSNKKFLDFGGGYGMFVRLMRDRGLDFYREDKYCENLFAKHFDIQEIQQKSGFEVVTAFELFEHLADPLNGIEEMLRYGKNIIFSTVLSANHDLSTWWYISPEIGQHLSVYHHKSLLVIAEKFGLHLCSNGNDLHMLTAEKKNQLAFKLLSKNKIATAVTALNHRKSLVAADIEKIKELIAK